MKSKLKKSLAALSAIVMASSGFGCNCLTCAAYTSQGDEVVSYAESTVGVIGNRPNQVTDFFNAVGEWCAMFIYYCAYQIGAGSKVPVSSYCDDYIDEQWNFEGGVTFFRNRNSFYDSLYRGGTYTPVRGDIIYFDWGDCYGCRDGKADHVGYVRYTSSDGVYVYTCEGNAEDMVQNRCYRLDSPDILGYGKPDYDDTGTSSDVQQPTVQQPVYDDNGGTGSGGIIYTVTSDVGAWARYNDSFGNNKIGIVSTGTILVSDKQAGVWIHFPEIPIEGSSVRYEGWINITTLTSGSISFGGVSAIPEPASPEISQPEISEGISEHGYISSNIGAWFRSTPGFEDDNKMGALYSGANVDIYGINGEWLYVGAYLYDSYIYGYVHEITVERGTYTGYDENDYNYDNSYGTIYTVMSPIGANFRQEPVCDDSNLIAVLGQYQQVEVLSIYGEWAYAIAYIDGYPIYGYISTYNF